MQQFLKGSRGNKLHRHSPLFHAGFPCSSLRILCDSLRYSCFILRILPRYFREWSALEALLIHENPRYLYHTHTAEEEVDRGQAGEVRCQLKRCFNSHFSGYIQYVPRLDNEAPPRPDCARACKGKVLCKRKLFRWSRKVAGPGEDKSPLPYVRRLPRPV